MEHVENLGESWESGGSSGRVGPRQGRDRSRESQEHRSLLD